MRRADTPDGLYVVGNPIMGEKGTRTGEFYNDVQEEICNVIEAAGVVLDGARRDQLLESLTTLILANGVSSDIRLFMDGQNGRPTRAAWQADKTIDLTSVFQAAIESIPEGGAGDFGLPVDTYITGPLLVNNRKITFRTIGGKGGVGAYPMIQLKALSYDNHFTVSGPSSRVIFLGVLLDGNKNNQIFASRGIYCTSTGATYSDSAVLSSSIVRNYKDTGVYLEQNRNNLWIINRSFVLQNDGRGVYGISSLDARIWQSDIGDSGLSNVFFEGSPAAVSENIRIGLCDIYHGGLLGGEDAHNVYLGNYVRSAFLIQNDYLRAGRYGVYVAPNSVAGATVDLIGGRFSYNSYQQHNTYSDVFVGMDGVTITGTVHQKAGAVNVVKYLVETTGLSAGASVGICNINFQADSYATGPTNDSTKTHWISKNRNYLARDQYLRFNQSTTSTALFESYGAGGGTQFQVQAGGRMRWGDGTNAVDASMERLAAGVMGFALGSFRLSETATYQMKSPDTTTLYHVWLDDLGRVRSKADPPPANKNDEGVVLSRDAAFAGLGTTGAVAVSMANVSAFTVTPTGDITFNATGGTAGARAAFVITTAGATSRAIAWGINFISSGILATGTVAGKSFAVNFVCVDGTTWVETSRTGAM